MIYSPTAGDMHRMLATAIELAVVGVLGLAAYAVVAKLLKMSELENAVDMFKGRLKRRRARQPA
jgi:hypothetical protein